MLAQLESGMSLIPMNHGNGMLHAYEITDPCGDRGGFHVITIVGALLLSSVLSQPIPAAATIQQGDADADRYIELLRKDVRSMKKQLIAANLLLSDSEAQQFWPIYEQYTTELSKINDRKVELIKDYGVNYSTMTNEQAEAYIKGRGAVEQSTNSLRLKYVPIFRRVLSGRATAQFFQIEWRVSLMIDLQLASQMPLIQP